MSARLNIIAAIDFGTTFSGFVFSFAEGNCFASTWISGMSNHVTQKTPTCILFNSKGKFDSYGYEAEEKYANLTLEDAHHDWYYFHRIKMMLYKNVNLTRETLIEDEKGMKLEASTVFSAAIRYLKEYMIKMGKNRLPDLDESDVSKWVLTVPAIWSDQSKQFMRNIAEMAGISVDKLSLVLEPEVASLYCMEQPVQKDSKNSSLLVFESGAKYMVVDVGGGTVDIVVHEVQDSGSLKELYKANGGDWGGTMVDESFRSLLNDIVGTDVMETFSRKHKYDFLDLFRNFEIRKRTITHNYADNAKFVFRFPNTFIEIFQAMHPECDNLTEFVSNSKYKNRLKWKSDRLQMDPQLAVSLYDESCNKIVAHIQQLFKQPLVKDVPTIVLVGGFAESSILQSAIREAFKDKKVIIPKEPELAVVKGAIMYGYNTKKISARVCKLTYGVKTTLRFDKTKHSESKKIVVNEVERCDDIFDTHVSVGQTIKVGEQQVERTYTVLYSDQKSITFPVYNSEKANPTYTTDEGCTFAGNLTIEMPDTSKGLNRGARVYMTFSGTEVAVTAVDRDDPEKTVTTTVNFLL